MYRDMNFNALLCAVFQIVGDRFGAETYGRILGCFEHLFVLVVVP